MNLNKKFSQFSEVAEALNSRGIVPILYGSLGLYKLIGQLDEIGDVDIIIPEEYVQKKFSDIVQIMTEIGYQQDPNFPHEFSSADGNVAFEPDSDLEEFGINPEALKTTKIDGVEFKELSIKDYLVFYQKVFADREAMLIKIKTKIEAIQSFLAETLDRIKPQE